jgi:predicted MFS family arabinose efflux permease
VPLSSVLSEGGEWHVVFYLAAIMAILAGVLALVALKPMRQREIARSEGMAGARGGVRLAEKPSGTTGEA